ncbi:MAG: serine/threonine-protein kinase, partial [Planctomycetota bacterium]
MAIQQCFDHATLEAFLGEQLSSAEESAVTEHIEICEQCREALASIAGDESVWSDIHENLEDLQFEKTEDHIYEDFPQDNRKDLERVKSLLAPTDDPKMLGRLGQYEVVGIIGRGSAGIVVKALDVRLNRYVAIKILAPVYSENGSARRRFEREGRSIASIRDNHVIPVYIVDEFQGHPYIVMQYVPGGSLQQRIDKGGPLDTREAALAGMQIARGLAAAHRRGVVHRDVKPANVLLDSGVERAMVTDFGLARVVDEATMTHSSAISGTPQYMSPEQAQGTHVDQRSDLFSLGSLLYAACTGHSPFRSETVFGVIKRVCESQPRPIREMNPAIAPWLEALISKLHSKNREDRFDSAVEVADILAKELAHLQSPTLVPEPSREWMPKPRKIRSVDWKRAGVGVLSVAVVGVVLAVWQPWDARNDSLGNLASSPSAEQSQAGIIVDFDDTKGLMTIAKDAVGNISGEVQTRLGTRNLERLLAVNDIQVPIKASVGKAIEIA